MSGFGIQPIDNLWDLLALLLNLLWIAILIRALLSWVNLDPRHPLIQALDAITEPILQPLRQIVPRFGMIDFTPMAAIIIISLIAQYVGSL